MPLFFHDILQVSPMVNKSEFVGVVIDNVPLTIEKHFFDIPFNFPVSISVIRIKQESI